tara:strand:- start:459 stop:1115 length:657 start_codon:yes stop_codon:yes gene_type:complete
MKKRTIIAIALLILLTTISTKKKVIISKFNLKEILISNNSLVKEKDIKFLLTPIYNKNLIFLKNSEIKKLLLEENFIESFKLKKKYPDTIKIEIFEKKPIAILINKKNKFYISKKIDLIEFKKLPNFQNLPYIFGDKENFKKLFYNLNEINFPLKEIKKYTLYETGRWDLKTKNDKTIKLPVENYIKSLENYLNIRSKKDFKNFEVFDYRINNQLILK